MVNEGLRLQGDASVTVLVMRSHKRFAIRQEARLRGASQRALRGLLIELSLDGCRIGNIDAVKFALGQSADLVIVAPG